MGATSWRRSTTGTRTKNREKKKRSEKRSGRGERESPRRQNFGCNIVEAQYNGQLTDAQGNPNAMANNLQIVRYY